MSEVMNVGVMNVGQSFRLGPTARSPCAGQPKAPGHTLRIHLRLEKRQQLFVIFKMAGTAEINDSRLVFDWMIFLLLWIDKNGLKRL